MCRGFTKARLDSLFVIQNTGGIFIAVNQPHRFLAFLRGNVVTVLGEGDRFVLIVLQGDVAQAGVGHVLQVDPSHSEVSFPPRFIAFPDIGSSFEINEADHLRDTTELFATNDAEEEIDWTLVSVLSVCVVQFTINLVLAGPNSVFDTDEDVFGIQTSHDEIFGILEVNLFDIRGIVVVELEAKILSGLLPFSIRRVFNAVSSNWSGPTILPTVTSITSGLIRTTSSVSGLVFMLTVSPRVLSGVGVRLGNLEVSSDWSFASLPGHHLSLVTPHHLVDGGVGQQ